MALREGACPDGGKVLSCAVLLDPEGGEDAHHLDGTGKASLWWQRRVQAGLSRQRQAGLWRQWGDIFLAPVAHGAGHWRREATAVGLPELFSSFGHTDLYEWWGHARAIVNQRVHGATNPARRENARRRYEETGYWGFGP